MTTFQLVMIGFGIVLVLGVMIYNWLQERRYRQQVNRLFTPMEGMAEIERPAQEETDAERIDPHIQLGDDSPEPDAAIDDLPPWEAAALTDDASGKQEPTLAPDPLPQAETQAAPIVTSVDFEPESPLDPQTEYIARLRFSQPVVAPAASLIDSMRQIGKPVRIMGQREDGEWEPVAGPSRTSLAALELGLQLADRSGAVATGQIDSFCRMLYNFAAEQGGAVSCPDKYAAVEKAAALDGFCIEVDVLIGLNIVAPDARPFLMSEIHRCAGEAGLSLQVDGTYAQRNEAGRILYSLANQAAEPFQPNAVGATSHGVTLLFDVPTVPDGLVVFDRVADIAMRLSKSLGGRLVDDNGKLVTHDSVQKIRQRLAEAYASMNARGIPAGGERANRLFV